MYTVSVMYLYHLLCVLLYVLCMMYFVLCICIMCYDITYVYPLGVYAYVCRHIRIPTRICIRTQKHIIHEQKAIHILIHNTRGVDIHIHIIHGHVPWYMNMFTRAELFMHMCICDLCVYRLNVYYVQYYAYMVSIHTYYIYTHACV